MDDVAPVAATTSNRKRRGRDGERQPGGSAVRPLSLLPEASPRASDPWPGR